MKLLRDKFNLQITHYLKKLALIIFVRNIVFFLRHVITIIEEKKLI